MSDSIDFFGPFDRALSKIDAAIVLNIVSHPDPPNAPSTIARKGSSGTLVDSGYMYRHVKHEIHGQGAELVGEVGIFDEEIAKYAQWNEEGTGTIPARPFMKPAFDSVAPQAADEAAAEIFDQCEKLLGW